MEIDLPQKQNCLRVIRIGCDRLIQCNGGLSEIPVLQVCARQLIFDCGDCREAVAQTFQVFQGLLGFALRQPNLRLQQPGFNICRIPEEDILDERQRFIELLLSEGDLCQHAPGLQGIRYLARDFLQAGLGLIRCAGACLEFRIRQARLGPDRCEFRRGFEFPIGVG